MCYLVRRAHPGVHFRGNTMKTIQLAALAAILATAVAAPTGTARADEYSKTFYSSNGGYVCKPQNGVFTNFAFGATLVRNISGSPQSLICNLPQIRQDDATTNFTLGVSGYRVKLLFANTDTAASTTFTCTATVSYAGMPAGSVTTSTKSITLAPSAAGNIEFLPADLIINDINAPVNVTCLVPAKGAFGRVDVTMP